MIEKIIEKTNREDGWNTSVPNLHLNTEAMIDTYSSEPFSFDEEISNRKNKASSSNTVVLSDLEKLIDNSVVQEFVFHGKQMVTSYKLSSGFCITGTASVVDPKNFNLTLGRKYCREDAIRKLWELEGYLLQNLLAQE